RAVLAGTACRDVRMRRGRAASARGTARAGPLRTPETGSVRGDAGRLTTTSVCARRGQGAGPPARPQVSETIRVPPGLGTGPVSADLAAADAVLAQNRDDGPLRVGQAHRGDVV